MENTKRQERGQVASGITIQYIFQLSSFSRTVEVEKPRHSNGPWRWSIITYCGRI